MIIYFGQKHRGGLEKIEIETKKLSPSLNKKLELLIKEGMDYLPAAYRVFDEERGASFKEEGVEIFCKKGCGDCCHQTFTISEIEFSYIIKNIDEFDQKTRYQLKRRIDAHTSVFRKHYKRESSLFSNRAISQREYQRFMLKLMGLMRNEASPCPFLQDNVCLIYPFRSYECRAAFSLQKCMEQQTETAATPYDFWLHDAIKAKIISEGETPNFLPFAYRLSESFR